MGGALAEEAGWPTTAVRIGRPAPIARPLCGKLIKGIRRDSFRLELFRQRPVDVRNGKTTLAAGAQTG